MTDEEWCTIESDPGVFTELIENFGVQGVQVEELYALDDELLSQLQPVYGLVFLFKWQPSSEKRAVADAPHVYFARQVITNACATQALLNIVLNVPSLSLGADLAAFKETTADFSPELKGLAMSNADVIKRAHNAFACSEAIAVSSAGAEGEAFHFVAYLPVAGVLYELDGLQEGPIALTPLPDERAWLQVATPFIQERMSKSSAQDIRFNLMALVQNRRDRYRAELAQLEKARVGGDTSVDGEIERLQSALANEEAKAAAWRAENVRRKHNYVPFLFALLQSLADKDLLAPLIARAQQLHKKD